MAFKLHREIPNSIILDQYINCANPMVHYETTAEEILESLNGNVDMVVIGAGTGGTFTGVSKKFEKRVPHCRVIGVDPVGSVIAGSGDGDAGKHFEVEGIGYDFVPAVLDASLVHEWQKTNDKETFMMAREINLKEGILSGGSSGAILVGALKSAKSLKKGQNCVVIFPDG